MILLILVISSLIIISIAISTISSLSACGTETTESKKEIHKAENDINKYRSKENKIYSDELRENTTLEAGQHYVFTRIVLSSRPENVKGGGFYSVPDGYEVFTINNFNEFYGDGSQTKGYDIWFVNTKKVKVKAVYSEDYQNYGYYDFGTVVEEKKLTK